jgi:hypothetical protein
MADWAIIIMATRGMARFAENALAGIQRCGIDPGIVHVVVPEAQLPDFEPLTSRFGAHCSTIAAIAGIPERPDEVDYADYGTADFNRFMSRRLPVVRSFLQRGKFVIHADADVGWLRNPLPYLQHVFSRHAWACQVESVPQFPPAYCFGFYAVRPTRTTRALINEHIARYDPANSSDQTLFRKLLIEKPRRTEDIFALPESLFPGGLLLERLGGGDRPSVAMAGKLEPFVVHANWTIGLDNKQKLLERAGAWLV